MIITFAGHGKMTVSNELRELIRKTIKEIIANEAVTFYCGGYGAFDIACAEVIKKLKNEHPNIESVFVTPYMNEARLSDIKASKLYDDILYPGLENVPYRFAISKRNEYMISKAALVIAYVEYEFGGAYKMLQYAKRKETRIINLATMYGLLHI